MTVYDADFWERHHGTLAPTWGTAPSPPSRRRLPDCGFHGGGPWSSARAMGATRSGSPGGDGP
ncbi:hypothetical protein GCM10027294_41330 [Marinactinospora endophytica]